MTDFELMATAVLERLGCNPPFTQIVQCSCGREYIPLNENVAFHTRHTRQDPDAFDHAHAFDISIYIRPKRLTVWRNGESTVYEWGEMERAIEDFLHD